MIIRKGYFTISELLTLFFVSLYVVNFVKFVNCDFTQPYKDEILHLIGVIIPPLSIITCWF